MVRAWLPGLLLAVYALAFGWRALGGGLLVFDDHPGQLYRIAHAVALGPWPWRIDPGWWAGYAELQYYPPGFAYAGAALHLVSLGRLDLSTTYQLLLWLTFLLPAATTYALLVRVLGSPWLALPGAFLALTLSAGARGGVEEGLRWGLVAARLGWGLLPLLALAGQRWTERARPPLVIPVLLSAIVLTHPAHAPAALILVFLAAWHGPGARPRRLGEAGLLSLAGLCLAAFWLLPLIVHLDMALPLAWGDASLRAVGQQITGRPLLIALALASAAAWWRPLPAAAAGTRGHWLALFAPAMVAVISADALLAPPLGVMWLPADRLVDSLLLALVLGACLAVRDAAHRFPRLPAAGLAIGAVAVSALLASPGRPEPTLTLWPRTGPAEWPKQNSVIAGARLDDLWRALGQAPPGRVLFVRSSVPLDYRPEWRRPHSHITSLTPLRAGREIINGTFTHPSPIAGLLYTGSPANRPIALLVEQRDGVTLFGRRLEALGPEEFNRLAEHLRISAVVALDEDDGRLAFVSDNPTFQSVSRVGPFLIFASRAPRAVPVRSGLQLWHLPVAGAAGDWASSGLAYSPLWKASAAGQPLDVRRDALGLLEVRLPSPAPTAVQLAHSPGHAEGSGLALTGIAILALAAWRRRRSPNAG